MTSSGDGSTGRFAIGRNTPLKVPTGEKVLERLHVKPAAVLKYKREKKQGEKYNRKVSLNKPPSEELSDSEQSSDSAAESSDSEQSSSSIGSDASLVPRILLLTCGRRSHIHQVRSFRCPHHSMELPPPLVQVSCFIIS